MKPEEQRALATLVLALRCALTDQGRSAVVRAARGEGRAEDVALLLQIPATQDFLDSCARLRAPKP